MRNVFLTVIVLFFWINSKGQNTVLLEEIETPPSFRSCNREEGDALRKCFYREFTTYIQENLVYPPEAILKRLDSRVYVSFVIDAKGRVINVMARGEHPSLEQEAIRLVTELPKVKPGMQNGEKISTQVNIPIQFRMPPERRTHTETYTRPEQYNDSIATNLEKVPVFPGCEGSTNEQAKDCFNRKMREHIGTHFNYPRMALIKNIQGTVYANFMINTDGTISDINLVAPHQLLADETIRILNLLPKITPGMQGGKKVRVPYAFPISFILVSPK